MTGHSPWSPSCPHSRQGPCEINYNISFGLIFNFDRIAFVCELEVASLGSASPPPLHTREFSAPPTCSRPFSSVHLSMTARVDFNASFPRFCIICARGSRRGPHNGWSAWDKFSTWLCYPFSIEGQTETCIVSPKAIWPQDPSLDAGGNPNSNSNKNPNSNPDANANHNPNPKQPDPPKQARAFWHALATQKDYALIFNNKHRCKDVKPARCSTTLINMRFI